MPTDLMQEAADRRAKAGIPKGFDLREAPMVQRAPATRLSEAEQRSARSTTRT